MGGVGATFESLSVDEVDFGLVVKLSLSSLVLLECVELIQEITEVGTGGFSLFSGCDGFPSGDISLSPGTSILYWVGSQVDWCNGGIVEICFSYQFCFRVCNISCGTANVCVTTCLALLKLCRSGDELWDIGILVHLHGHGGGLELCLSCGLSFAGSEHEWDCDVLKHLLG